MIQAPGQATPLPPQRFSAQDALIFKRDELRSQLKELAQRRGDLQGQRSLVSSSSPVAKDLEGRIAVMDARTAKLESDLFTTNDLITRGITDAAPSGQGTTQDTRDAVRESARAGARNAARGAGVSIAALLALLVVWRAIKSFFPTRRRAEALPDNSPQLAQLQQSLDVIAVEVERISEAQRYQAKIMSEKGLTAGEAHPLSVGQREQVGAKPGRS